MCWPPWQAEPIRQNDRRTSMISSGKDSVMKSARLLNRREFNGLWALGSFVASSGALALDAATAVALNGTAQTVKFRDGAAVPAVGQGLRVSGREDIRQLKKKKR
jgi:hypothetical protein